MNSVLLSLPLIGILIAVESVVNEKYFWFRVNWIYESFSLTINQVSLFIYLDSFPLYRYWCTVFIFLNCVTDSTMIKTKKYQLNYNMACYNYQTGMYENNIGTYLTREEALRNKWKCEKCSGTFQSYRMLYAHKTQFHAY